MEKEPMRASKTGKKRAKNKKKRKLGLIIGIIVLLVILIPLAIGSGLFFYYVKDTPELDYSKLEDTLSSKLYDNNGNLILELGEKKRETIKSNEIPPQLKDAVLSIEDKRFEKHIGVDPIRIAGAAISNFRGNQLQGGSTLTQQLIKLSYFSTKTEDQTLKRKAQEAWLSIQLEKEKSKDEILTYYINRVYMSNGVYGMRTAAETFFDKPITELTLAQYALLAGLPQSPNDYDPYVHPEDAKKRRDIVLNEMLKDKKISQSQHDEAVATPVDDGLIEQKPDSEIMKVADNYIKQVLEEVEEKTGKNVYTAGLDVYTNLDMAAQKYLYNLVNSDDSPINFPNDDFQTAVSLMDNTNGQVHAQIGGRKIKEKGQLMYNGAVSNKRDIGSTAKPIVAYGPAVETLNYGSGRIVVDEPYTYADGTKLNNFDFRYRGPMSIRAALYESRNVPAVKTLKEVGNDEAAAFLKKIGIDEAVYESTAITLNVSMEKLAAAYSAFANGGTYYKPSYVNRVVYPNETEEVFEPEGKRAMKESTAYIITDMLKNVIQQGTGTAASIPGLYQAGKTGTSNYSDADLPKVKGYGNPDITFAGYTTKYALAVWTGYEDYKRAIYPWEQQLAMDIYRNFMSYLYTDMESTDWKQPDSVVRVGNEVYVKDHVNDQFNYSRTWTTTTEVTVTEEETTVSSSETSEESETPPSSSQTPPSESAPAPTPSQPSSEPPAQNSSAPPANNNPDTNKKE